MTKLIQHNDVKIIELQCTITLYIQVSVVFKVPMKPNKKVALNCGIDNILTAHFSILPLVSLLFSLDPTQR